MKSNLLLSICLIPAIAFADMSRVEKALQDGVLTRTMLQALTHDDVPQKWKTTHVAEETSSYQKIVFSRGGREILHVTVPKKPPKDNPGMFVATIKIDGARIATISRMSDSVSVVTDNRDSGYNVGFTRKDDGRLQVAILSKQGLEDGVEVDGIKTHLIDDLEFMKAQIVQQNILVPLIDSINETLDKKEKP